MTALAYTTVSGLPTPALEVNRWLEWLPEAYHSWVLWGVIVLLALVVLRSVCCRVVRRIRRRRPPRIHPRLEKYNVDRAQLDRQRRERAAAIVTTSTGNRLAGFRIVRQIEAVFVEGYRSPEEALVGLKAAAAERGANALLNVKTERTAAGRCTASADAVVATPITASPASGASSALPPASD